MKPVSIVFMVLAIFLLPPHVVEAQTVDARKELLRFNELFDNAKSADDFRAAATTLESLVEEGFRNGAVYYNLGNAYYRAGEFGRAILNYRKAKPYRPQDPLLEANLQQAIAAAPGKTKSTTQALVVLCLFLDRVTGYYQPHLDRLELHRFGAANRPRCGLVPNSTVNCFRMCTRYDWCGVYLGCLFECA